MSRVTGQPTKLIEPQSSGQSLQVKGQDGRHSVEIQDLKSKRLPLLGRKDANQIQPGMVSKGDRLSKNAATVKSQVKSKLPFADKKFKSLRRHMKSYQKHCNRNLADFKPAGGRFKSPGSHRLSDARKDLVAIKTTANKLLNSNPGGPRSQSLKAVVDSVDVELSILDSIQSAFGEKDSHAQFRDKLLNDQDIPDVTLGELGDLFQAGAGLNSALMLKRFDLSAAEAKDIFERGSSLLEKGLSQEDVILLLHESRYQGQPMSARDAQRFIDSGVDIDQAMALHQTGMFGVRVPEFVEHGGSAQSAKRFKEAGANSAIEICQLQKHAGGIQCDDDTLKDLIAWARTAPDEQWGTELRAFEPFVTGGGSASTIAEFRELGCSITEAAAAMKHGHSPQSIRQLAFQLGIGREEAARIAGTGITKQHVSELIDSGLSTQQALEHVRAGCTLEVKQAFEKSGFNTQETLACTKVGWKDPSKISLGQFRDVNRSTNPVTKEPEPFIALKGGAITEEVSHGNYQIDGKPKHVVFSAEPDDFPNAAVLFLIKPEDTWPGGSSGEPPRMSQRNVATHVVAKKILKTDVVPHTEFAVKDGKAGNVMDWAEGKAVNDCELVVEEGSFEPFNEVDEILKRFDNDEEKMIKELKAEGKLARRKNDGGWEIGKLRRVPNDIDVFDPDLMREGTWLQLVDLVTGQGDRHSGNYFVHKDDNGKVSVRAIDNDLSCGTFPHNPDDLAGKKASRSVKMPQVVSRDMVDVFSDLDAQAKLREELSDLLTEAELDAMDKRWDAIRSHLDSLPDSQIVDDWSSPEAKLAFQEHAKAENSYIMRDMKYFTQPSND